MTIKLLFCDVEGTIFEKRFLDRPHDHGHSLWTRIFEDLGPAAVADDEIGVARFDSGEYSYTQWCEYAVRTIQKHGLKKDQFEALIRDLAYSEHVQSTITELHRRGIRIAMISGGFLEQAERAQRDLRIQHSYAATRLYWNEQGALDFWNIVPSDYQAKAAFVDMLIEECGFTKEECAFIGDGKNDVAIASHVGMSFAYQAHAKLRDAATHTIEDFRDILKYL